MRIALFASGNVGRAALSVMLDAGHPPSAVVGELDEIVELADLADLGDAHCFSAEELATNEGLARFETLEIDLGVLAWWNRILRQPLLGVPRLGFLNFHPSFLPYNRGKHYNFWTLVEDTPFGVTIHWVDDGIDDGDIAFQRRIDKSWEDTGESLYLRAGTAIVELFRESLGRILVGDIPREPQSAGVGQFHRSRELDEASQISLERTYSARSLLNLMRARTFPPHPGAWFEDEGMRFEVELRIRQVDRG